MGTYSSFLKGGEIVQDMKWLGNLMGGDFERTNEDVIKDYLLSGAWEEKRNSILTSQVLFGFGDGASQWSTLSLSNWTTGGVDTSDVKLCMEMLPVVINVEHSICATWINRLASIELQRWSQVQKKTIQKNREYTRYKKYLAGNSDYEEYKDYDNEKEEAKLASEIQELADEKNEKWASEVKDIEGGSLIEDTIPDYIYAKGYVENYKLMDPTTQKPISSYREVDQDDMEGNDIFKGYVASMSKSVQDLANDLAKEMINSAAAQDTASRKIKIGNISTSFLQGLNASLDLDGINQKLAEIPMTIEDKIQEIKDILDKLLGRFLDASMNPMSFKFDPNIPLNMLMNILMPLISCTDPLKAVASIPIIGDLASLLSMLGSSSSPSMLTEDEIKKLLEKMKPQIPVDIMTNIDGIVDNIKTLCVMLPFILINIILQMINVIYSKLKIITSIIPLGSFFPLTLIDAAIDSIPNIQAFIFKFPGIMKAFVMGIIKRKLCEIMALSIPTLGEVELPEIDVEVEIGDSSDGTSSGGTSVPKKKQTFNDVVKKFFEKFKRYLNMIDLTTILTHWKRINNYNSITNLPKEKINHYKVQQNVEVTVKQTEKVKNDDGTESEKVTEIKKKVDKVEVEQLNRNEATPDDFEAYLLNDLKLTDDKLAYLDKMQKIQNTDVDSLLSEWPTDKQALADAKAEEQDDFKYVVKSDYVQAVNELKQYKAGTKEYNDKFNFVYYKIMKTESIVGADNYQLYKKYINETMKENGTQIVFDHMHVIFDCEVPSNI